MDLSTHGLSATVELAGIRSLVRFGTPRGALAYPVLYPRRPSRDALPK